MTKIIILSGKAGSGKSETSKTLIEILNKNNKKAISISYASYLKEYAKNILNWDGNEESKPRSFLQELGDDIKNKINPKFLINRIIDDIKIYSNYFDVIIISDARFENEINDIKNLFNDVLVIHIIGKENNLSLIQKNHITETSLDNYNKYDFEICNISTKENLKNNLENLVVKIYE